MTLDQVTRWRYSISKLGAFFCAMFIIASLDVLVAYMRQPLNVYDVLPGESVSVNGPMGEKAKGIEDLYFISSSDLVRLNFEATQTGFWFGGQMWRGVISVNPESSPGEYSLTVYPKEAPAQKPLAIFGIKVFPDRASLRRSSKSFILSYLGISPWWIFAVFFPLTLLMFGGVYLLSHRRDQLLAEQGKAEIYKMAKTEGSYEIAFGLGARHGVKSGAELPLYDGQGNRIGSAKVQQVYEEDSTALVEVTCPVKPGYLVSVEE